MQYTQQGLCSVLFLLTSVCYQWRWSHAQPGSELTSQGFIQRGGGGGGAGGEASPPKFGTVV